MISSRIPKKHFNSKYRCCIAVIEKLGTKKVGNGAEFQCAGCKSTISVQDDRWVRQRHSKG